MRNYIEKTLDVGENITYRTKLHWLIFCAPVFMFLSFLFFLNIDQPVLSYASLFVGIGYGVSSIVNYLTSEFAVTNRRVILKTGAFSTTSFEMQFNKIESVQIYQPFFGGILDYGTITITGTGGSKEKFSMIVNPFEFRKRVQICHNTI